MRVFLDTNILLDILLNRAELVEESSAVILLCESSRHEMFIAWHGLATAYYLLRRGRSEAAAQLEVASCWFFERRRGQTLRQTP
jgi:predicted nucleic acid-binding protein